MSDSKQQDNPSIDDIRLDAVPVDKDDIQQEVAQVEGVALANAEESTLGDVFRDWWRRVRVGDIGSLPIIVGLIVIAVIFGIAEPLFFSSRNFVNLLLQMAGIATIAIGVVFVLLIGALLVLIIYTWTPPHFWALAIHRHKEYAKAAIPMLPVTHGIAYTKLSILLYTILLAIATLLPFVIQMSGWLYLAGALLLNAGFLYYAKRG